MSCTYGLLIDYGFCTGCHACEVACKQELKLPEGQFGIKILQDGPRDLGNKKWEYNHYPVPTSLCNLCKNRRAEGKPPTCVMHCPAHVMYFGTVEELSALAAERKNRALYTPWDGE